MNFDRIKNLFSKPTQPPVQEFHIQPQKTEKIDELPNAEKDTEPVRIRGINPFAFGAAGYPVGESIEFQLWSDLGQRYKRDGVSPLTYESILGPTSDSQYYLDRKAALDNLITPSSGKKPLLVVEENGKIIPSKKFGILY